MNIAISAPATSLLVDEVVAVTVSVTNFGPEDALDVWANIDVPDGFVIEAVETRAPYRILALPDGVQVACDFFLGLRPEEVETVVLALRAASAGTTQLRAEAGASSADPDNNNNVDKLEFSIEDPPVFDLEFLLTPSSCAMARDLATNQIHLNIINRGPGTAVSVVVNDTLPAGTTVTSVTGSIPVPWDVVGQVFMAWLDSIPAGDGVDIDLDVALTVDGFTTTSGFVTAAGIELDPSNDSDFAEIVVLPPPDLIVNTSDDLDDGVCDALHCSLREALTAANVNYLPKIIAFRIPGAGVHTIRPTSELPGLSRPASVDGWYQEGFCGEPLIELDGSLSGSIVGGGINLNRGDTYVRGLIVNRFSGIPIKLGSGSGQAMDGCWIGTDASGTIHLPNSSHVSVSADSSRVGGPHPWQRNVIAGSYGWALMAIGGPAPGSPLGVTIQNNYVGTDVTGRRNFGSDAAGVYLYGVEEALIVDNLISGHGLRPDPRNNQPGIWSDHTHSGTIEIRGNRIGTDATGTIAIPNAGGGIKIEGGGLFTGPPFYIIEDNLVSGNMTEGIELTTGNGIVRGNRVGVDSSGLAALPNTTAGLLVKASAVTVGGPGPADGNVLSGNLTYGLEVSGELEDATVQGNTVGLGTDGVTPVPNGSGITAGIKVFAADNSAVGGPNPGEGNLVGSNGGDGIQLLGSVTNLGIEGNTIRDNAGDGVHFIGDGPQAVRLTSNAISGNGQLGVDLDPNGPNSDDPFDLDVGANGLQNAPALLTAIVDGDSVRVTASLHSAASQSFDVEIFANSVCDTSGFGEAETPLAIVGATTDAGGDATIDYVFFHGGAPPFALSMIATDAAGNSSEISNCMEVATPTGVDDIPDRILKVALHQNTPNPFNPQTLIRFELPAPGPITLRIYDVSGRLVKTLVQGLFPAGTHDQIWRGDDEAGLAVASGMYFGVLKTKYGSERRKMVLLR